jgi:hypothetical protein
MNPDYRQTLIEMLAQLDQWLAEAEALKRIPSDEEDRKLVAKMLADLKQARDEVEAKLRAE